MAQKSQTLSYIRPGVYEFVVPEGISEIDVYLWGAGGASGQGAVSTTIPTGQVQVGTRIIGQALVSPQTVRTRVVTEDRIIPGQPGYVVPGGSRVVTDPGTTTVELPRGVTQATVVATGGGGGGGISTASNRPTGKAPVQTATGTTVSSAKGQPTQVGKGSAPVVNRGIK